MKSPCYKCENRSAECRLSCTAWKEYEVAHFKELEERHIVRMQADDIKSFKILAAEKGRRRR